MTPHGRELSFVLPFSCLCIALIALPSNGESELWKINIDGTGRQRFAETPGFRCGSPDWSPDGQWVAYDTWPLNGGFRDSQVAVIRADGTGQKLLGRGAMPSWSPDGKQLVCHTYDDGGGIVVMNADGMGRETILEHWGSPRWSPRGNRIASISNGTIALYDFETGEERPIFREQYPMRQGFAISPDGLRFCFPDTSGGVGIATLDEETMQAKVRWVVTSEQCFHASWAPDGKRVVFALAPTEDGGDQLYTMDVDNETTPTWLPGQDRTRTNTNPDWSPDGKTIIYCRQGTFEPASE
jgi:Tol biopolymer transport system component